MSGITREAAAASAAALRSELERHVLGQSAVIDQLLVCLAAGGHALLEGVPGLAKTLLVSSLARATELRFNRIQFTPDLMPSDIVGTEVIRENKDSGERSLVFIQGPVFASLILADEINRTPPKTQAALLEAMQERMVTAGGESRKLPEPFFVLATQNPLEQEGTYVLPEAQLDRFLMKIAIDYPAEDDEVAIVMSTTSSTATDHQTVIDGSQLLAIQGLVRETQIAEDVARYAIALVRASRTDADSDVAKLVRWGAGPRAGQALLLCAKARATLDGRDRVGFDDIRAVAHPVLRHRLQPNYEAEAQELGADALIDRLLENVPRAQSSTAGNSQVQSLLA